MANISKINRESLLNKIESLKQFISSGKRNEETEKLISYLYEIKLEIDSKKYGLVFEEHRENTDKLLEENVPIFSEEGECKISANSSKYNFLLEGDNLPSLELLLKTHKRRIDVIYIDPPYNTGKKDFVYDDAFVDKTDTFKHSKWLSFMEKRLKFAQKLLSDTGVILISIDDNEQAILKILCDSIFGDQNFLTMFVRKTKSMTGDDGNGLNIQHEYLLAYAKNKDKATFTGEPKTFDNYSNPDNDPNGIWTSADPSAKSGGDSTYFPIQNPITGQIDFPPKGRYWAFSKETMKKYIDSGRIKFKNKITKNQRGFVFKRYAETMEVTTQPVGTLCFDDNAYMNSVATSETNSLIGAGKFSYPKPVEFIKNLIKYTSNKDSIILDFFAGSGTTGHAVMKLNQEDGGNRKFILCTNNENNICKDVTYTRIKAAIETHSFNEGLKYLKVDYVDKKDKLYYEFADDLLNHIRELVELENAIDFDNDSSVKIILTEEELDSALNNEVFGFDTLYLGHDVLLTAEQLEILNKGNIKLNIIPEYFYKDVEE